MLKIAYASLLVYLQPFRRNLLLKCALQPKIAKNSPKPPFLGIQGRLRLSMLTNLKSPSPVLVMICSKSVPICNRFHTIKANSGKNNALVREEPLYSVARNFVTKN